MGGRRAAACEEKGSPMSDMHPPREYPPDVPAPLDTQPPPAGGPQPGTPVQAPKKRTGLVIALVVVGVLLLCCCPATVGVVLWAASGSNNSTGSSSTAGPVDTKETKRIAEWEAAESRFPTSGYETVAPNERQQRLAGEATRLLYPDFTLDETRISPRGYFEGYDYDGYATRLHLTADPSVRFIAGYWVVTPAGRAVSRYDLNLEPEDGLDQLEGDAWVIYTAEARKTLGGVGDQPYAALMAKACEDWSGADVDAIYPASDGSVTMRMSVWDSRWRSKAPDQVGDYVDAVYRKSGDPWKLERYEIVIGSQEDTQTGTGATATPK
jgi:hypothetical protein